MATVPTLPTTETLPITAEQICQEIYEMEGVSVYVTEGLTFKQGYRRWRRHHHLTNEGVKAENFLTLVKHRMNQFIKECAVYH